MPREKRARAARSEEDAGKLGHWWQSLVVSLWKHGSFQSFITGEQRVEVYPQGRHRPPATAWFGGPFRPPKPSPHLLSTRLPAGRFKLGQVCQSPIQLGLQVPDAQ